MTRIREEEEETGPKRHGRHTFDEVDRVEFDFVASVSK